MNMVNSSLRFAATRLLMIALTCFVSLPISAYDFMVDGIAYILNDDSASVSVTYTDYPGNNYNVNYTDVTSIIVPSSVNYEGKDYAVTTIGNLAFSMCTTLKQVILPEGLIKIGQNAFAVCTQLESINIPNTVTDIEAGAFIQTAIREIVIPNSVVNLGFSAFSNCWELTQITLSEGLRNIAKPVFELHQSEKDYIAF